MNSILQMLRTRGLNPRGELPDDLKIDHVTEVSSQCGPTSLFVALKGAGDKPKDGHDYLADAAAHGAKAAVVARVPENQIDGMSFIQVDDTRKAAGPLAQFVFGNPTHRMDVVGVTGTNGKTTTVFLLETILKAAGRNPGIMGTVLNRWAGKEMIAQETTPSGPRIASIMAMMQRDGVDCVAFETSSHAIDQRRIDGIRYRAAALTNVTQDHLDYHKSMAEYEAVKMSLFDRMLEENPEGIAVLNLDDPTGRKVAQKLPDKNKLTYGVEAADADLRGESVELVDDGIRFVLNYKGARQPISSPLFGYFNVMNSLTAAGLALAIGVDMKSIAQGCANFRGAPGRFQVVEGSAGFKVIVDYAHTPDAVIKLLQNARTLAKGRLIAVFGCGGDRDRTKRPLMGKAAMELADDLIVTNDNPRTEVAETIAEQIVAGFDQASGPRKPFQVILDRRAAIYSAIQMANDGDVIVIAGKGHEDYQIVGTEKHHFDDRETARQAIADLLQYEETADNQINPTATAS